jgi:hypothetical protein
MQPYLESVLGSGIRAANVARNPAITVATMGKGRAMSATDEQVLTQEDLDERIKEGGLAAFREIDCTRFQGEAEDVDPQKVAEGIMPLVLAAKVNALDERSDNALIKGDLTAKFLPEIIGPQDPEWEEAGPVAHGIWDWCERRVWNQTNPNVSGKVQAMVRKKKLTLCHTKVSRNHMLLPAIYVTADLECIRQDFALALKTSVRNAANKLAKNMAAAIDTHPEFAKQLAKEVESGMKNATQLAKATLALSAGEPEDDE